ncbi:MAG: CCA tRNA nucleotidyltransferase [Faecalibacterium sp.]
MTTIKLDPGAALLLDALHGAGHAAYAVGGCVRDSLLGLDPHDWDLCTSARPEQVMALFGEEKCIPTGLQHGTVTVKQGGRLYETTTFRTEGAYSDGRHPDAVCFVPDVREDLARRDFTINAMAYSAEEGLIDPFGGRDDLAAHLVRAVGEPERRFEEDALRILRLYRFAARFGFAIDPATGAAARALGPHLDCVSAERIQEELLKLLAAPRPGSYLEPAVLAVVLPELEPEKQPERFAELCRTIDRIEPTAENVPARLAALLCPQGEAGARKALRKLKCSNALTDEVTALEREAGGGAGSFLLGHESGHSIARPIACGNRVPPQRTVLGETPDTPVQTPCVTPVSEEEAPGTPGSDQTLMAKRLLGRYELPTIQRLTALCSARHPEQTGAFAALRAEAERLTAENACCRVSQLAVNGRDLMAAGVRPGPGLRQVLNALLEAVITGQTPNEKDALLAAAAQFSAS